MRTREELAWAAGFFDGEGHTSAQVMETRHKGPRISCKLNIGQQDPEVLYQFQSALGMGSVVEPNRLRTRRDGGPLPWRYNLCTFQKVQAALVMLWPWLGTAKKNQALLVLRKYHLFEEARYAATLLS